jgi:hypothetical protein
MKSGRGGKRVGAGRPVQDEDRGKLHTFTVRLYPDQWSKLKRFGNRSEIVRRLIDKMGG